MRRQVLALAVVLCAFAVAAAAADITGKWVAQMPGRDGGTTEQVFMFKQSGENLTGSITTPRGEQQISEGKVAGDTVSFVTVMSFGGNEMKMAYKGTIAGNEIKFTRSMQGGPGGGGGRGGPMEFVAKKAN